MRTCAPAASDEARLPVRGEALTRHAVTVITAAIVVMTFAFSLGNVTRLCLLCRRRHNWHYAKFLVMSMCFVLWLLKVTCGAGEVGMIRVAWP